MHFIFYFESAKCAEQNRGYFFFFSTFRDATQDSAQEFHNGFRPALTIKKKLFLAEKSNKCDQCITKIFTENLVYEERVFYHLNQ